MNTSFEQKPGGENMPPKRHHQHATNEVGADYFHECMERQLTAKRRDAAIISLLGNSWEVLATEKNGAENCANTNVWFGENHQDPFWCFHHISKVPISWENAFEPLNQTGGSRPSASGRGRRTSGRSAKVGCQGGNPKMV